MEIGPGRGELTHHLAARAGRVVAVELDDRLIEPLQQAFADQPHVTIHHGDILDLDHVQLVTAAADAPPTYKVVANLPYYITSAFLRQLLEARVRPTLAILMMQAEVAERICAQPGSLSILAVSVQFYAEPSLILRVPARAFRPPPKVDSAVVRLDLRGEPAVPDVEPTWFFRVVRAGFSQPRKQLLNTISAGLHLSRDAAAAALTQAEIDPTRRAETLRLDEWGALCRVLAEQMAPPPAAT